MGVALKVAQLPERGVAAVSGAVGIALSFYDRPSAAGWVTRYVERPLLHHASSKAEQQKSTCSRFVERKVRLSMIAPQWDGATLDRAEELACGL